MAESENEDGAVILKFLITCTANRRPTQIPRSRHHTVVQHCYNGDVSFLWESFEL